MFELQQIHCCLLYTSQCYRCELALLERFLFTYSCRVIVIMCLIIMQLILNLLASTAFQHSPGSVLTSFVLEASAGYSSFHTPTTCQFRFIPFPSFLGYSFPHFQTLLYFDVARKPESSPVSGIFFPFIFFQALNKEERLHLLVVL